MGIPKRKPPESKGRSLASVNNGIGKSYFDPVADQIIALKGQGVEALRIAWALRFRRPVPRIQSTDTLRRIYAWSLQVEAFGDLDDEIFKLLSRARAFLKKGKSSIGTVGPQLRPGTVLVREWHGVLHRVLVLNEGFEHDGQRYRTLTEAARVITGTRWSGPKFFGLINDVKRIKIASADPGGCSQ
jgi:hypothetical protein